MARALPKQSSDLLELAVHDLAERDGIERGLEMSKPGPLVSGQPRPAQQSLSGCLGPVVGFLHPTAVPFLLLELHDRLEEVLQQPPLVPVQVMNQLDQLRLIVPCVAEQQPHLGPVLLLHMRVVILPIGSTAGEVDGAKAFPKVAPEGVVDELSAIVRVEPQQRKQQAGFD